MQTVRWWLAWVFLAVGIAFIGRSHGQDPTPGQPANRTDLRTLSRIREVIDLGMERAAANPHPVRVRGVITFVARGWRNWIYVQDATGGTLTIYDSADGELVEGTEVEVEGVVGVGDFHTLIQKARVRAVGMAPTPTPFSANAEQLARGSSSATGCAFPL